MLRAITSCLLFLLFVLPLQALQILPYGEFPDSEVEQAPPIRIIVEEVTVPFIVVDGRNRYVTNLEKEDFQVLEEKRPQEIISFVRENDLPLRLGLLVDTSNSIRDRFVFEQEAASNFLRAMLRPGKDKAFLASFDTMAELVHDFTDQVEELVDGINRLRPGGGTALYDAIYYGARDRLLEEAPVSGNYRRSMILLSDGEDNQSRFSRLQALEMAQRAEVTIYAISTNIRGFRMQGDKVLREFSEETGGRYFQPTRWEDLDSTFREIENELRNQYSLSYRPTAPRDGRYHSIEIIPNKKGLKVRARLGYFATTPAANNPR